MSTINLQVQGMTCSSCIRHVTQALTAVAGVDRVAVDLNTGLARVEGNADRTVLITALDDAGYPAHAANNTTPTTAPNTGCGSGCGCR
jgi:copper chaperone